MEKTTRDSWIRRQYVEVFLKNGEIKHHKICDLAMPSPDGKFFLVRDLTDYKESPGRKGDSHDYFYPIDTIFRVEVTSKRYALLSADGSRGQEILDNSETIGQIIT